MSAITAETSDQETRVVAALLPIMLSVLVVFLVIGLALPVLPLHVHEGLGLGTFVVGLVTGAQFSTSLIARVWSGHFSDTRGAKRAVVAGLLGASASGAISRPGGGQGGGSGRAGRRLGVGGHLPALDALRGPSAGFGLNPTLRTRAARRL